MSGTTSNPLVRAPVLQRNDAGSFHTVSNFIAFLEVVNLMEKQFFHAQTKPVTRRQMLTPGECLP